MRRQASFTVTSRPRASVGNCPRSEASPAACQQGCRLVLVLLCAVQARSKRQARHGEERHHHHDDGPALVVVGQHIVHVTAQADDERIALQLLEVQQARRIIGQRAIRDGDAAHLPLHEQEPGLIRKFSGHEPGLEGRARHEHAIAPQQDHCPGGLDAKLFMEGLQAVQFDGHEHHLYAPDRPGEPHRHRNTPFAGHATAHRIADVELAAALLMAGLPPGGGADAIARERPERKTDGAQPPERPSCT